MSRYSQVTEISQEQYLQLAGLLALGRYHRRMLEDLNRAACQITGEKYNDGGHTSDAFFEDYTVELLLGNLEIKVSKE